MKKVLTDFIAFDSHVMTDVYEKDYNWGEEDYEADVDTAITLLEQVEHRLKSLGHHLAKEKTKETAYSEQMV
jgi:hypothetical protein